MVAPIIATVARGAGAVIKGVSKADSTRRLAGSAVTRTFIDQGDTPQEARKKATSAIRKSATRSAKEAVSKERAAITTMLKESGMTGAERVQWRKDNKDVVKNRVAQARQEARAEYDQMLVGAKNTHANVSKATARRIADQLINQGDVAKAVSTARSTATAALARVRRVFEAGGVTIDGVEVKGVAREATIDMIINRMASGKTGAEAVRATVTPLLRLPRKTANDLVGREALEVWQAFRESNNLITRVQNMRTLTPTQQAATMRKLGFTKVGDKWVDDADVEWTPEDVADVTEGELFTTDPYRLKGSANANLNYAATTTKFPMSLASNWLDAKVRSFSTSLKSANINTNYPVTYTLIMAKVSKLTPAEMKRVIENGVISNYLVYFSSDRDTIVSNIRRLLIDLGIKPEEIPAAEQDDFTMRSEYEAFYSGKIDGVQLSDIWTAQQLGGEEYARQLAKYGLIPETY